MPFNPCKAFVEAISGVAEADLFAGLYTPSEDGSLRLDVPLDGQDGATGSALSSRVPVDLQWNAVRGVPYQILEPLFNDALAIPLDELVSHLVETTGDFSQWSSSFTMINHADHYYFYRKEHEHVPGTMLIEAQRQAVYYHLYKHTKHKRNQITVSLNELNSCFYAYAELMYPIEIVVDDLTPGNSCRPRKIYYRVSFYQRQKLIAVVDTKATVIDMPGFEKIRNIFLTADDWYIPIQKHRVQCQLVIDDAERVDVQVVRISKTGCVTRVTDVDPHRVRSLVVSDTEGVSFGHDIEFGRNLDENQILWQFLNSSPKKIIDIGRVIKRGFVISDVPQSCA